MSWASVVAAAGTAFLLIAVLSINLTLLHKVDDVVGVHEFDLATMKEIKQVLAHCETLNDEAQLHNERVLANRLQLEAEEKEAKKKQQGSTTSAATHAEPAKTAKPISGGWLDRIRVAVGVVTVPPTPEEYIRQLQGKLQLQQSDSAGLLEQAGAMRKEREECRKEHSMLLVEMEALRKQLKERDAELVELTSKSLLEVPEMPVPKPDDMAKTIREWTLRSGLEESLPLRSRGEYYTPKNWESLQTLVVLVATGAVNHRTRAKYHVNSWMKLMPNVSNVYFISDKDDGQLSPFGVIAIPNDEPDRNGFQAAQRRFIRGLVRMTEMLKGNGVVKWVYLMDDDAFMHPPNFAKLVPKLDHKLPHFYGEMCGGLPGVVFPCGGGGILTSVYTLRRSLRALKSCYLAKDGQMGQYDVAISHCFANAGVTAHPRAEFCSQPPRWYMPGGKGQSFNEQFKDYVSFHYVTSEMGLLWKKTIYGIEWFPTTTTLPPGVTPDISILDVEPPNLTFAAPASGLPLKDFLEAARRREETTTIATTSVLTTTASTSSSTTTTPSTK